MTELGTASPHAAPPASPSRLRRAPHLAQRRLGDEVVVMDLRAGKLYGFNVAGGELLDWLKPGRSIAALRRPEAGSGVGEFLALLLDRGLVAAAADDEVADADGTALPAGEPRLLWQEEAVRVTNQTSPPQALTNPQCLP